jgi:hypothetical protein
VAGPRQTGRQHVLGRLFHTQTPTARWLRSILVVLAILAGLAHLRARSQSLTSDRIYDKDIVQEYTMARAILDGVDPYLPITELAERYVGSPPNPLLNHPSPHPPTLALLTLPLAWFGFRTAAVLWFVLELFCLAASVYLLARALGVQLSTPATLGMSLVLLIWYPFSTDLALGQLQLPMLALLAGAWLALQSRRSTLAGALVGLAILVKTIALPVLLLFLLRKDRRALVAAASVVAGGYLLSACVLRPDALWTYFSVVLPSVNTHYRSFWGNSSIASLAWRVFSGTQDTGVTIIRPLIQSMAAATAASVGLPLLLWAVACWALRGQRDLGVSMALLVSVSILAAPVAWDHYLVLAALPGAQVIHWLHHRGFPSAETNWAIVVAMSLLIPWVHVGTIAAAQVALARRSLTLPFALTLLPVMPAVAVGALAWLVLRLGPVSADMAPDQSAM